MNKVTDADYYLPHIFASSPIDEAANGTTEPVIIRGINEKTHNESGEYYVKPVGAPRMVGSASLFEMLAALMAKQIDLNVAKPVLVNISEPFITLCKGKSYFPQLGVVSRLRHTVPQSPDCCLGSRSSKCPNGHLKVGRKQVSNLSILPITSSSPPQIKTHPNK